MLFDNESKVIKKKKEFQRYSEFYPKFIREE